MIKLKKALLGLLLAMSFLNALPAQAGLWAHSMTVLEAERYIDWYIRHYDPIKNLGPAQDGIAREHIWLQWGGRLAHWTDSEYHLFPKDTIKAEVKKVIYDTHNYCDVPARQDHIRACYIDYIDSAYRKLTQ